jgi:hypothetical protein
VSREQDPDLNTETKMRVRVLKCRETGETGAADILNYNRANGRIELVGPHAGDQFPDDVGATEEEL